WGSLLGRLFPQVLSSWSGPRDPPPGQERPFGAVRSRLYQVLELWVQVAGAASGILQSPGSPSEALLAQLLSDISAPCEATKVRPKTLLEPQNPSLHPKTAPCTPKMPPLYPKTPSFVPQ
ncbi:PELP1 protein, partial [Molothrus ater]|nr:PELP1 protein [Molothrus ater]